MPISVKRKAVLLAGPYTRLLAEHEAAMANLYSFFAETLKSSASFWNNMSEEELAHKALIEGIDEKFRDGEWIFARPNFITTAIIDSCEHINERKKFVAQNGISMREALKQALELEHSLIESDFFKIIDTDNASLMNVLKSLKSYTYTHMRKLENEAKRMKWRFFGGRKHINRNSSTDLSRNALQKNIKDVQATMIGHLISMEESISALYNTYSARLENSSRFWAALAAEEMQHAAMLRKLYLVLERGCIFYKMAPFSEKKIVTEVDKLINLEFDARYGELSPHIAVNQALRIERSLIESGFYTSVESDAPEYRHIAERMIQLSREHVQRLEDEVGKTIDIGTRAAIPVKRLKK